jgi:trigger factor
LKATVKEPFNWKRVIEVEIPHDTVENAYQENLAKYRRKVKLEGFRQGKVPEAIIKSRFGSAIRAETIDSLIQKSFENTCREHNILPISQAKVNSLKADEGAPLTFSIETEVDPKVEIEGYQKLKIKVNTQKVKPAQVDEVVKDLQGRLATFQDVPRQSKKGDFVTIEYVKVVIDGKERADVTSPQYPLEVGESKIKEFDKSLMGKSLEDVVDVEFKFPKDYADADIANKEAAFTVKVKKIQERILPEINEEFLKKLGDFKDEETLRDKVQKDLEARELDRAKSEAYTKAIEELIKDNPFEVPPSRVEGYIDYVLEETKKNAKEGEVPPTREQIAERYRETGIKTIKRFMIINSIAIKEKIRPTQEEVDGEIKNIAERYGQPFDKVKDALRQNGTTNRIREDIRERKTLDYLIGEYTPPAEQPAAEPTQE